MTNWPVGNLKTVYVGEYGFNISSETGRDLTTAVEIRYSVRRPDGTFIRRLLSEDGVSRVGTRIICPVQEGDITVPGIYTTQGYVNFQGAEYRIGKEAVFQALPVLDQGGQDNG